MSERNETMAKLLAADAPAARDMACELAVMARIEQRRFAGTVTRSLGLAAVAALGLASLAPFLDSLPAALDGWTRAFMPTDTLMIAALILSAALTLWQANLARNS